MNKQKKNSGNVLLQVMSKVAKQEAIRSANSTCEYILHQPKAPADLKKLRKF